MVVSGGHLSLFGRTALSNVGVSRAAMGPAPEPVDPAGALKDATLSQHQERQGLKQHDREVRRPEQARMATGGPGVRGDAGSGYEQGTDNRHAQNALSAYRGAAETTRKTQPGPLLDLIA
jgi:hypothetical protein